MRSITRSSLLSLAFLPFAGLATAGTLPATGLGQSWPNATDLSVSSHFHVYAFLKSGIRYIQVNDTAGNVRGAIGYVGGEVLDLPIGADASRWEIVTGGSAPAIGEMVYHDDAMTVHAAPQRDGTVRLLVESSCQGNPAECSVKGP